jgi:hypothetical protein
MLGNTNYSGFEVFTAFFTNYSIPNMRTRILKTCKSKKSKAIPVTGREGP